MDSFWYIDMVKVHVNYVFGDFNVWWPYRGKGEFYISNFGRTSIFNAPSYLNQQTLHLFVNLLVIDSTGARQVSITFWYCFWIFVILVSGFVSFEYLWVTGKFEDFLGIANNQWYLEYGRLIFYLTIQDRTILTERRQLFKYLYLYKFVFVFVLLAFSWDLYF